MWATRIGIVLGLAMAVAAVGAPRPGWAAGDGSHSAARRALDARMGFDLAHQEAHGKYWSKAYSACLEAASGVTVSMLNCATPEDERLDGALNLAYRERLAVLPPARRRRLRELQRSWLKERRRYCNTTVVDTKRGSFATVVSVGCYLETTIERTLFIYRFR